MTQQAPPSSVEELHDRLKAMANDLPKRMAQCADFVATNPDRIALSTVAELAQAAGVQPSAFMRFCRLLGFTGFSQMQRLFRATLTEQLPDYSQRIANLRARGTGSPAALLAEFSDAGRQSLENLSNTIDYRILDEAVETLSAARMLHVVGLRRAFPVAAYLAYAFEKMEIPSMIHDGMGMLNNSNAMQEGDALIAISFAPYSQESLQLAAAARERNLPVVAMTDGRFGPLHADDILVLTVSEVDFGAFRSLSATLALAITLAVAVGAKRGKVD